MADKQNIDRSPVDMTLRESGEFYRFILESVPDAIMTVESSGNIVLWNRGAEALFGYAAGEIVGKKFTTIIPERFRSMHNSNFRELIQNKKFKINSNPVEGIGIRKDGTELVTEQTYCMHRLEDQYFVTAVGRDITGRKQMEDSLREFKIAVEQSADGMAFADMDGIIRFMNGAWARMHGYSVDELIGRHLSIFHTKKQLETEVLPFNERALATGSSEGEVGHVRKDGTTFPAWMTSTVVKSADQQASGWLGIARDITEHKRTDEALRESESKYRNLFEMESDALLPIDAESGAILDVNSAAIALYGYSRDELLGMRNVDLSAEPEGTRKASITALSNGVVHIPLRYHRKKDGTVFPVEVTMIPFVLNGRPALLPTIRDISERKRIEEELLKAKKFEAISTFSGGLAHDFNNLLAGVLNYITLSKDDIKKPEDALKFLDEAEKIVLQAKEVTGEFLILSGFGIEYKNTAGPSKVIKDTAAQSLKNSTVKCEFTLPEEDWEVLISPRLLSRIISSVVANSREAMPNGGIVTIKAEHITHTS